MGQAKQRGSMGERIAAAKERRRETPLSDIRKQMGLPENAEFLGCVINVRGSDEYLAVLEEDGVTIRRGYVMSPENALRYESREEAEAVAASLPKSAVSGLLFDLGDQFFVSLQPSHLYSSVEAVQSSIFFEGACDGETWSGILARATGGMASK